LPGGTSVGAVHLAVSDLERSLAYYQGVLGMAVIDRSTGTARLSAPGDLEPLIVLSETPGARPVPRRGRLGLYHFAILLPDRRALGQFVRHVTERGLRPGMSDHLVSEALYLTDPDGLGIEVYADRPRDRWRSAGGQLVMAIDPLDLEDLARAAGGKLWTGMPAGTRMGHVHLHVGDLVEAERFYHDALGFDKIAWSYPGALFLSAGGYHHHLGTNVWATGATAPEAGEAHLREWTLVLPDARDVTAAATSLDHAGYSLVRDARGVVTHDPWGTQLALRSSTR